MISLHTFLEVVDTLLLVVLEHKLVEILFVLLEA